MTTIKKIQNKFVQKKENTSERVRTALQDNDLWSKFLYDGLYDRFEQVGVLLVLYTVLERDVQ
jgi:hypothetical protein